MSIAHLGIAAETPERGNERVAPHDMLAEQSTLGGMLLGWIAGQMAVTDPAVKPYFPDEKVWEYGAALAGALLVLAIGKFAGRKPDDRDQAPA